MIPLVLKAGKKNVLAITVTLVVAVSMADWATGHNVSLGALYILPMMLAAVVLRPVPIFFLAVLCSCLRSFFDIPASTPELLLRFVFSVVAYTLSGLFVSELVRNRGLALSHLESIQKEQALRREAEEQLKVLAESSPAAILTVDRRGTVLAANSAANRLFSINGGEHLQGRLIRDYLPVLADALRLEMGPGGLHTAAQCQGRRDNGEIFLAHMWFSTYPSPEGTRLAAIVVDSSEEMRDREEQGLRQLLRGNRIAAAAFSHEVRNFCGPIGVLCSSLTRRHGLKDDEDLRGLLQLTGGLQALAGVELEAQAQDVVGQVPLREVLDNLRIVIEPDWREIDGVVRWSVPPDLPSVLGEPHGLLQAFLNLAQNSHRAVLDAPAKEIDIAVSLEDDKAIVRFRDSGPGVFAPERLFQPFQPGAEGAGVGLYVSRSIVRSYGGELRFEPAPAGSCFAVELRIV